MFADMIEQSKEREVFFAQWWYFENPINAVKMSLLGLEESDFDMNEETF